MELLQITQKADGSLEGTLNHTELSANGVLHSESFNIGGAVDGHSITLSTKTLMPFVPAMNMSGTIDQGVIIIMLPSGAEHYTESSLAAYQMVLQEMHAQGVAIQQQRRVEAVEAGRQKHISEESTAVRALNKQLSDYVAMVKSPQNEQQLAMFHATHAKAMEAVRRALEDQKKYPRGSVPASQISVAISQTEVGLTNYDLQWELVPERARTHLREFDSAISNSPCIRTDAALRDCAGQPAAIKMYQAVKPLVLRRIDEIVGTMKNDAVAIMNIEKQADAYAQ